MVRLRHVLCLLNNTLSTSKPLSKGKKAADICWERSCEVGWNKGYSKQVTNTEFALLLLHLQFIDHLMLIIFF
jgi:hypothetical protein